MIVTNPFTVGTWTRDQIKAVSEGWWVLLLSGIIGLIAGGAILFVDRTIGEFITFLGLLFVVRGIFMTLSVPVDGAARAWSVGLGLVEVGVGLAVWTWPRPTLFAVAMVIGWWFLVAGLMMMAGAIVGRHVLPYWGLTLAFGTFQTIFSFWLLARPGVTLVAAVVALGVWNIVSGVVHIVLAFEVKGLQKRADLPVGRVERVPSPDTLDSALG